MSASLDQSRSQQLHAAAELADRAGGESTERFLRRYYRHVAPEDLLGRDPSDVARRRAVAPRSSPPAGPQGTANVRVYTPTVEEHGWACGHTVVEIVTDDMPFLVDSVTAELSPAAAAASTWSSTRSSWSAATSPATLHRGPRRDVDRRAATVRRRSSSRWMHVEIDRETDEATCEADRAPTCSGCSPTCARRSRTGRKMRERAPRIADELAAEPAAPASAPRRSPRPASCCAGWPTTTSPSSATASTRSSQRDDGDDAAARRARHRPGHPARTTSRASRQLRPADRRGARQGARAAAARSSPRPTPRHRAPARPTSTTSASRRSTPTARSSASAASSACSPPPPTPSASAASRCCAARSPRCWSAPGFAPRQPRRQGPARRSWRPTRATSCSRSSVDELLRHRASRVLHLQERRQTAAVPAPRRLRPVHLLPGLPARATATPPASGCGCSDILLRGVRRRQRRLHRPGHRVGAGPAALRRPRRPGHAAARRRRGRRSSARLVDATRSWDDDFADALRDRAAARRRRARLAAPLRRRVPRGATRTTSPPRAAVADLRRLEALERRRATIGAATSTSRPARRRTSAGSRSTASARRCRCPQVLPRAAATWASRSSTSGRTRSTAPTATAPGSTTSGCATTPRRASAGRRRRASASRTRSPRSGAAQAESDGFNALVLRAGLTWRQVDGAARVREVPAPGRHRRSARTTSSDACIAQPAASPRLLVALFEARFDPRAARRRARRRAAGRRAGRGDRAARSTRWPASTRTGSCARFLDADPGDAAHELLPARRRRRGRSRTWRSSSTRRRCPDLPAPRPKFEIWVYSPAGRGRAPALRHGRPRRAALVRPARGLPHRGPRPGQGADGEERRDRAGRRQGRLRRQAAARPGGRPRGRGWPRASPATSTFISGAARRHRQPASAAQVVPPRGRGAARRRRPLPGRRRRQGHRDVLRHRQRASPSTTASGSATRSPPAARPATTTRRWASPPAARGSRSSGTSASSASTPRPRTSPSSASATCPATCSATACCSPSTSGWSPPSTTGTSSSTPTPDAGDVVRRAPAAVRAAALVVGRLRHGADLARAAASSRAPRSRSRSRRRCARRSASPTSVTHADAGRADAGDPRGAGRPAVERRHRHLREGVAPRPTPRSATRPTTRCGSTARELRVQGGRRGRQPRA